MFRQGFTPSSGQRAIADLIFSPNPPKVIIWSHPGGSEKLRVGKTTLAMELAVTSNVVFNIIYVSACKRDCNKFIWGVRDRIPIDDGAYYANSEFLGRSSPKQTIRTSTMLFITVNIAHLLTGGGRNQPCLVIVDTADDITDKNGFAFIQQLYETPHQVVLLIMDPSGTSTMSKASKVLALPAMIAWTICAARMGVCKDVRQMIAKEMFDMMVVTRETKINFLKK